MKWQVAFCLLTLSACADPKSATFTIQPQRPDLDAIQVVAHADDEPERQFMNCLFRANGTQTGLCPLEASQSEWTGGTQTLKIVFYGESGVAVDVRATGLSEEQPVIVRTGRLSLPGSFGFVLPPKLQKNEECDLQLPGDGRLLGHEVNDIAPELTAVTVINADSDPELEIVVASGGRLHAIDYEAGTFVTPGGAAAACALEASLQLLPEIRCPVRKNGLLVGNIGPSGGPGLVAMCGGEGIDAPATRGRYTLRTIPLPSSPFNFVYRSGEALSRATTRPMLADLDNDGRDEVAVLTVSGPRETRARVVFEGSTEREVTLGRFPLSRGLDGGFLPVAPILGPTSPESLLVVGYTSYAARVTAAGSPLEFLNDAIQEPAVAAPAAAQVDGEAIAVYLSAFEAQENSLVVKLRNGGEARLRTEIERFRDFDPRPDVHVAIGDVLGQGTLSYVIAVGGSIVAAPMAFDEEEVELDFEFEPLDNQLQSVLLHDFDGDAGAEIVVYDPDAGTFRLVHPTTQQLLWEEPLTVPATGEPRALLADLDADGSVELIVFQYPMLKVFSFGGGTFESGTSWPVETGGLDGSGAYQVK